MSRELSILRIVDEMQMENQIYRSAFAEFEESDVYLRKEECDSRIGSARKGGCEIALVVVRLADYGVNKSCS